jgi:hypothetical protein
MDYTKRRFDYIDAMPGAGKTEFFIVQACRALRRVVGSQEDQKILIYVAPTMKLLGEAFKRIQKKVGQQANQIRVVANPYDMAAELADTDYPVGRDQPTTALNFLFGLITADQYQRIRYQVGFDHQLTSELQLGDVVMTTHESFVRLNRRDKTGRQFKLLSNMVVIFDEARKCVLRSEELKVPKDQWELMWTALKVKRVHSNSRKDNVHLYRVEAVASIKDLCAHFGVSFKRKSLLPDHMKGMLKLFNKYGRDGRGELYILCHSNPREVCLSNDLSDKITIQVVMRPTALFENYGKVILTSAFFRDSQMYHFLRRDGHKLRSLLGTSPLHPALQAIKERSERLRVAATKRLHVATLISSEQKGSSRSEYRNTLTSGLLDNGMLVPAGQSSELHESVLPQLTISQVLQGVVDQDPKRNLVCKNKKDDQQLAYYAVPPLWLLLDEAAKILNRWTTKFDPQCRYSLLTLNVVSDRRWTPSGVRYLRVVRHLLDRGKLEARRSRSDLTDSAHNLDTKLTPAYMKTRLREILYDGIGNDCSLFTVPSTPHLHGINKYSHMSAFTHLAALNPGPALITVYRMLIPDYDIDQDHSIENLVQTLYRTSLRNPDAREPVLMIIPFESSADLLAQKINVKSFKKINKPKFTMFHHVKTRSRESIEYMKTRVREANTKFDPQYAQELGILRRRVNAVKAYLRKNPNSEKAKNRLITQERALKNLKATAILIPTRTINKQ